jgi:hypothetical protein
MQILCPTCHGKGLIDDPKITGVLCYCGPNGESCPQVICMSCGGSGWVSNISTNEINPPNQPRAEETTRISTIEVLTNKIGDSYDQY